MFIQPRFLAAFLAVAGIAVTAQAQGNDQFLGPAQNRTARPAGPAKPAAPAPRDAAGKIVLGSLPGERQGLWAPGPAQVANPADVPFLPWAKAL